MRKILSSGFLALFFGGMCLSARGQVLPLEKMTLREKAVYMAEHYWDGFDYSDTSMLSVPFFREQAIPNYLVMMQHAGNVAACKSVAKCLEKASVSPAMYNFFMEVFLYYLDDPNSPLRNEACAEVLFSDKASRGGLSAADSSRTAFRLAMFRKNAPGTKAADFQLRTIEGKSMRLYDLSSDYTLLMFYNPGCEECARLFKSLAVDTSLNRLIRNGKMSVLAMYPDNDTNLWIRHKAKIPKAWINAFDDKFTIDKDRVYYLRAIPCLYLLDKEKNVLLRDAKEEELAEYLKKLAI